MNYQELIKKAEAAQANAYVPYSHFRVGAALLTKSGQVFTGCNVENASYGLTNCAERTAVFKAVSEGHTDFEAIAIIGDTPNYLSPCGACRQVLLEFGPEIKVIMANSKGEYTVQTVGELLPGSFTKEELVKVGGTQ
ncbi:MAG: cytidine deaminase [Clostridia bacterium]|nr:cytidine deaminase [Clostridia bacterium]